MSKKRDDEILRRIYAGRGKKNRDRSPVPLWLSLAAVAVVLIIALFVLIPRLDKGTPSTENAGGSGTDGVTTEAPETSPYPGYTEITLASEDVFYGDLLLVNYEHPYTFPDTSDIINIYENKTDDYKLAETSLELDSRVLTYLNEMLTDFAETMDRQDVIINSGYRSLELQQEIYDTRLAAYGEEYVKSYVANPGCSEHHTGYAVDMAVYTDEGVGMTFDKDTDFEWFTYAAHTYGFVLRYAVDKVDITHISNEPWHFRYVGCPHAYYMYENNLCLEEYLNLLTSYTFEGEHLTVRDDEEKEWEIYYVRSNGERTTLYIPENREYTISGNNYDGYIVTASK